MPTTTARARDDGIRRQGKLAQGGGRPGRRPRPCGHRQRLRDHLAERAGDQCLNDLRQINTQARYRNASMGLPRPPGSPITLPATGCRLTLTAPMALRRCAGPDEVVRTHPFAPDARTRPGKTPVRTAFSPRYLIRMRSWGESSPAREPQVQTPLSGTDGSELLVQVLDRLAVAPRFQVKPELSHVLEVRLYLLLRGDP
jgi:hypothetical protein